MFNPHYNKNLSHIYRAAAILLGFAVLLIAAWLFRASRMLKFSEEKFFKAFENAPVMKSISGVASGLFLDVNIKFCEVTGFKKADIVGRNSEEIGLLSPEDRRMLYDFIQQKGRFLDVSLKVHAANGAVLDCVCFGELVKFGKKEQILSVILDVTEQKKMQQQLLQSQKIEAVGQLTGGIAHDFNNLLTIIGGYANLLDMNMKPQDINKAKVQHILSATEKAGNLTHSLLAFSRTQIMKQENVDLNSIVFNLGAFIQRVIGEDLSFNTSLCDDLLPVYVDGGQIEQVLINLATNARDAMPEGGILSIETCHQTIDDVYVRCHGCGKPGRYAVLSVSDTGTGMDEKTRNMIFEPFFTTKKVGKGTGLGMAMVYGIVKQHNGFIFVYSEQGHGTAFRIYLPLLEQNCATEAQSALPVPLLTGSETVLVVEDEAVVRQVTEEVLRLGGYEVMLAGNGKEALLLYAEHHARIQLVVMDMIMPVMGGREAYQEMKKISAGVRVLFCSGYSLDMLQLKGELGDHSELIMKPLAPRDLLKTVREVLDRV